MPAKKWQLWTHHDQEQEMPKSAPPRRRPARALPLVATGLVLALGLSACSVRKQYGVSTTLQAGKGTCDSSRQVELGAALDLSGPEGPLGKEYLAGLQMGLADVNHHQGVLKNHSCLELLYKNTEGNVRVADKAVLDLVNNEVVSFLVGPFGSSEVQFSGADLGLAGVPTTSMSSLDSTTNVKTYPQMFPVVPTEQLTAQKAASYARSQHWSQVAAIGENNPAGKEGVSDFARAASADGLTVTGKASGADYQSELSTLQSGGAQALYVAGDDLGIEPILKAKAAMGWNVPVVADQVAADSAVVSDLGSGGTKGISAVVPAALVGTTSDPNLTEFLAALRKSHPSLAGSAAPYAEAYDGIELLAYVANSINSIHPGDVRTFIENANYQGVAGSYGYSSHSHTGFSESLLKVAPLSGLSAGTFSG
jgi:ABC-type branched-subunit amino acid transport system substrate-binding protein